MQTNSEEVMESKTASFSFTEDQAIQQRFIALQNGGLFGGALPKPEAANFSTVYRDYLLSKETDSAEFKKKYVAGTYFTIGELENYFAVIKGNNPGISSKDIRVYLCPIKYPAGTFNPINTQNVGDKIATCIIFLKDPYGFTPGGGAPVINGNSNFLGAYNWGDLEP